MSTKIEASPQDAEPEQSAGEHPGVGEHREHRDSLIDTDDVPPEVAIRHLIFGGWTAQALRAMVSLDLADHLAHGSRTVDDLANAAAVDAQTLRRLLAVLKGPRQVSSRVVSWGCGGHAGGARAILRGGRCRT